MLEEVVESLRGLECLWFIAGGWAISNRVGRQFREHPDVDIGVLRADQLVVQNFLKGWKWTKSLDQVSSPWVEGDYLEKPTFETHATRNELKIEFLLHDTESGHWIFRRNPLVTLPVNELCRKAERGVTFLSPAVALLFKAKKPSATDQLDFEMARPYLLPQERSWLLRAIESTHPGHEWLTLLGEDGTLDVLKE